MVGHVDLPAATFDPEFEIMWKVASGTLACAALIGAHPRHELLVARISEARGGFFFFLVAIRADRERDGAANDPVAHGLERFVTHIAAEYCHLAFLHNF